MNHGTKEAKAAREALKPTVKAKPTPKPKAKQPAIPTDINHHQV